jgi:hypothetical protein
VEAALKAIEAHEAEAGDGRRQIELALEQARYESNRAQRQYDSVDPENRIVAAELERRWNERLQVVREVETKLAQFDTQQRPSLSEAERAQLLMLGTDLERAWNHPAATPDTRKRILRTLIVEIIARVDGDQIDLMIHWQGGDHTQIKVRKARNGETRWTLNAIFSRSSGSKRAYFCELMPISRDFSLTCRSLANGMLGDAQINQDKTPAG